MNFNRIVLNTANFITPEVAAALCGTNTVTGRLLNTYLHECEIPPEISYSVKLTRKDCIETKNRLLACTYRRNHSLETEGPFNLSAAAAVFNKRRRLLLVNSLKLATDCIDQQSLRSLWHAKARPSVHWNAGCIGYRRND